MCRVKFLQRSYHRSRVLKIQKYHQALLSDGDELDKLSLPVLSLIRISVILGVSALTLTPWYRSGTFARAIRT